MNRPLFYILQDAQTELHLSLAWRISKRCLPDRWFRQTKLCMLNAILAQALTEVQPGWSPEVAGTRPTEPTCLTIKEEVEGLRHVIEIAGISDSCEAFDVKQEDAERGAISTLNKVLNYFDEHGIGDEAR